MAKPAGGHFGFGDGLFRAVFFGFGLGLTVGLAETVAVGDALTVGLTVALAVGVTVALAVGFADVFVVALGVGVGFFVCASALLDEASKATATKRASFFTDVPT